MSTPGTTGGRLWPWSVRSAVIAVPVALAVLLVVFAITRAAADWPEPAHESAVLIAIVVLALLPLWLILLGRVIAGGAVEAFGVRLEFAPDEHVQPETEVSPRLGLSFGEVLDDSGTAQILDTLRAAVRHEVAVVDLEDGTAWWETRLLVLCAGAARQERPSAIVFVAVAAGVERVFKGWANPAELLKVLLVRRTDFRDAHDRAAVITRQWQLVSPTTNPSAPFVLPLINPARPDIDHIVFDGDKRNPYAEEQILAMELSQLEMTGQHGTLTTVRLDELFHSVLRTAATDLDATGHAETDFVRAALSTTDRFVAVTHGEQYAGLVLREQAINDLLRTLIPADPGGDQPRR
jgi:hypothetical protein